MSKKDFRRHGGDKNRCEQHSGVAAGSPTAADFAEEFEQLTASLKNASSKTKNSGEPCAEDFEEYDDSASSLSAILCESGKICAFPFLLTWKGIKFGISKIYSCGGTALCLLKRFGSLFVLKNGFGEETETEETANETAQPKSPVSVPAIPAVKTAVKIADNPKSAAEAADDEDEDYTVPRWTNWVFKSAAVTAVLLLSISGYFGFKMLMKSTPHAENNPEIVNVDSSAAGSSAENSSAKKNITEMNIAENIPSNMPNIPSFGSPFAAPAPPPPALPSPAVAQPVVAQPAAAQKKEIKKEIKKEPENEPKNETITAKNELPKPAVKPEAKPESKPETKPAESNSASVNSVFGSAAPDNTAPNNTVLGNDPWAVSASPRTNSASSNSEPASSASANPAPSPADSLWTLPPVPPAAEKDTVKNPPKTDIAKVGSTKVDSTKIGSTENDSTKNNNMKNDAAKIDIDTVKNDAVKIDAAKTEAALKPKPKPEVKPEPKTAVAAVQPNKPLVQAEAGETVRPLAMMPLESGTQENPLTRRMPSAAASGSGKIASSPLQPLAAEEKAPNIVSKKDSAPAIPASQNVRPLVQTPLVQNPLLQNPPSAPPDNKNDSRNANPFFGDTIKPLVPPKEMKPDKPLLIPDSEEKPLIVSQALPKTTPAISAAMAEPSLEIPKDSEKGSAAVFRQKTPENMMPLNTQLPDIREQNVRGQDAQGQQSAVVFADKTGEPALGSKLHNQLKEIRSSSEPEPMLSFRNRNVQPLAVPQSPDSDADNPLLKLMPTGKPAENAAEIKQTLPPETDVPKPILAEVNPGYRRFIESARPAPLQISSTYINNADTAATAGRAQEERAKLFLDKVDEQIKRSPAETEKYTVQQGDTYMTISDMKFGTSLLYRALATHNRRLGIDYMPAPGTVIEVPTAEFLKINYADVLSRGYRREAQQNSTGKRISAADVPANSLPLSSSPLNSSAQRYTVQQNDNVFKIAMNQLGDTSRWREILALNSAAVGDPRNLLPGTEILLPDQSASIRTAERSRKVF